MADVWFCAQCGYEVNKRGKCHNCRQPLTASPLAELAEGEADDEVGYSLEDWDDSARGDLIVALVGAEIRHRFDGDELVVAVSAEEAVDQLIAELSDTGPDDEPGTARVGKPDQAALELLAGLYDAAQRVRADPTDMVADGDVAEAAGRMFAMEQPAGVDDEAWAAMGRVSRRLLGALGADEALEGEISESAEVLCRLIEEIDLAGDAGGSAGSAGSAGSDDDDPGFARLNVPASDGADSDGSGGMSGDATVAELSPGTPAADDQMVFELEDWMPEERAQVSLLLDRNQITHEWEGTDLIVAAADDERVENLMGEVSRSTSPELAASEEGDDETQYHVLSNLFGAADKLAGDPESKQKRSDTTDAAKNIAEWPTPFAMSDNDWWKIRLRAKSLTDAIELDASAGTVQDHATTLRDLLRAFV